MIDDDHTRAIADRLRADGRLVTTVSTRGAADVSCADGRIVRDGQVVALDQLEVVGRVEPIPQGESGRLEVTLERAEYVLICNLPGHYAAGMYSALTVN